MGNISIILGDITKATTDAIVNAANSTMLGGGGVDGAIHQAAGSQLVEHCRKIPVVKGVRCPVGEARITPAGQLHARWVIHAVGPRYDIDPQPQLLLEQAYRNSLILAKDNGCQSVALPAISCGVYRFPHDEAARIALSVCAQSRWADIDIVFYLFSEDMVGTWKAAHESINTIHGVDR